MTDADYLARLKSRCVITANGCWEKTGFRRTPRGMAHRGPDFGYGLMCYRNKNWSAHRLAWKLVNGDIPTGMLVMHKCDNPPCCNPDHLKLGTSLDNQKDMSAKKRAAGQSKTHCKRGHELSGENLYLAPYKGRFLRSCKTCNRLRQRKEWIQQATA